MHFWFIYVQGDDQKFEIFVKLMGIYQQNKKSPKLIVQQGFTAAVHELFYHPSFLLNVNETKKFSFYKQGLAESG